MGPTVQFLLIWGYIQIFIYNYDQNQESLEQLLWVMLLKALLLFFFSQVENGLLLGFLYPIPSSGSSLAPLELTGKQITLHSLPASHKASFQPQMLENIFPIDLNTTNISLSHHSCIWWISLEPQGIISTAA